MLRFTFVVLMCFFSLFYLMARKWEISRDLVFHPNHLFRTDGFLKCAFFGDMFIRARVFPLAEAVIDDLLSELRR